MQSNITKRLKCNHDDKSSIDTPMFVDDKILSSDIDHSIQATTIPNAFPYHTSVCGSLLYSIPTNSSSAIYSYLRHGNFDAFRRSFDVYYNEIIQMRNDRGQTVLHILVIHAYAYLWVRLIMMRGCDTCAQDSDGYTAVHYAVERDDVEMLKALTLRFHAHAKPIPDEQITAVHEKSLRALTLKENRGLTPFMLACHCESLKCLNYLIELKINDSHLQDQHGDTCIQYAAARRNPILIEKLISTCQADVNGGNAIRPSALDIVQYNREQQKPFERAKDDEIERVLLSHHAKSRCSIRRVANKRKDHESFATNLACLALDLTGNASIETARSHARVGASLQTKGDYEGAQASYKHAMAYVAEDTLDWATYAFQSAIIHIIRGERPLALELCEKALRIREQIEKTSEDIDQIKRAIETIHKNTD